MPIYLYEGGYLKYNLGIGGGLPAMCVHVHLILLTPYRKLHQV